MPVESPLPENHPLMIAWKEYQKSESFDNIQRWIFIPEHTHGSQWALFRDGYNASELQIQSLTTLCEELVEALNAINEQLHCPARNTTMTSYRRDGSVIISHDLREQAEKALAHYSELLKKKE